MKNVISESQSSDKYSDEEINELADWLEDLTLKQAFFLKESYEGYLIQQSQAAGCVYVQ